MNRMSNPLSSTDVQTRFYEQSNETVFVGYKSHHTDSARLFAELEFIVMKILEDDSVSAIEGAIFHSEHPVIATWHVQDTWVERYRSEALPTVGVLSKVLQELETASFQ